MSNWLSEPQKSQIPEILNLISHYKLTRGEIFLTGELSYIFNEYLILLEAKENPPVYMRIYYESIGGVQRLTNIELDSPYKNSRKQGRFIQTPKLQNCEQN